MSNPNPTIENRLDQLTEQVLVLTARVDELTALTRALSQKSPPVQVPPTPEDSTEPSSGLGKFIAAPTFLLGVGTVCFFLVVALILRTIADTKVVNQPLGTALGIAYASCLILYGYRRYARTQPLAAIYVVCGGFLLLSIVFETHSSFHVISAPLAYTILGVSLAVMTGLGLRSGRFVPIYTGILGTTLTGMALDFPDSLFPALAGLLLLANGAAYVSGRVPKCAWLKWAVLFITLFFWFVWTLKARVPLMKGKIPPFELAPQWIILGLGAFTLGATLVLAAAVLKKTATVGLYETVLPMLNAAIVVVVVQTIAIPYHSASGLTSTVGVGLALVYMILAVLFLQTSEKGARAAPSFTTAFVVLLMAFLPGCIGNASAVLLIWSLIAVGIAAIPPLARNPYLLLISHLFQSVACIGAIFSGSLSVNPSPTFGQAVIASLLAGICLAHRVLSRAASARFSRHYPDKIDAASYTTVLLLGAGLLYTFGASRMLLSFGLNSFHAGDDAFQAGQSVLINLGALAVALAGVKAKDGEMLAVAVVIAIVGAAKVFAYDFAHLRGVLLVLSIFSFAVTATLGSVLCGRWQRLPVRQGPDEPPGKTP